MLGQMLTSLAAKRGQSVTLEVRSGETYNPATGNSYTTTSTSMTGVMRTYSTSEIGGADGMVAAGDREITVDGGQFGGVLPSTSCRLVVNGEEQTLVRRGGIMAGTQYVTVWFHVRGTA